MVLAELHLGPGGSGLAWRSYYFMCHSQLFRLLASHQNDDKNEVEHAQIRQRGVPVLLQHVS